MRYLLIIPFLLQLVFTQPNCNNENIELWGECYNIEETTFINFSYQEGSDYPPLSGEIPPEIGQLVNMTDLYLGGNELTTIPPEIGNLVNLQSLFLYDNQFISIPSEIGNLVNLTTLDIGYNQITELPVELYSLNNLEVLRLEYNELTILSNDLCNLSDCNIYINNNQLCPPYPECISQGDIDSQDTSSCNESLLGDVDLSGNVNVADIVMLVNWILNDIFDEAGDLDESGSVNVADIVMLVGIILNN